MSAEPPAKVPSGWCPSCGFSCRSTRVHFTLPSARLMASSENCSAPASPGTASSRRACRARRSGCSCPGRAAATFHLTFLVSLHSSGGLAAGASPVPERAAPRRPRLRGRRRALRLDVMAAVRQDADASASPATTMPTRRPSLTRIRPPPASGHRERRTHEPGRGMMRPLVRCGLLPVPGFRLTALPCPSRRDSGALRGARAACWQPSASSRRSAQPEPRWPSPGLSPAQPGAQPAAPARAGRRRAPTPTCSGPIRSRSRACRAARSKGRSIWKSRVFPNTVARVLDLRAGPVRRVGAGGRDDLPGRPQVRERRAGVPGAGGDGQPDPPQGDAGHDRPVRQSRATTARPSPRTASAPATAPSSTTRRTATTRGC